jgi:F-type H+-transporting ATPase subunit a
MGYNLDFTNSSLVMLIGFTTSVVLFAILPRIYAKAKVLLQVYVKFIDDLVLTNIGEKGKFLAPFVSSLFLTIFFGNLIGLFPKSYTFTANLAPNLVLASSVIGLTTILGFYLNGLDFLRVFCPAGIPLLVQPFIFGIELVMFCIRVPVLTMRLAINMTVGHIILGSFLLVGESLGSFGAAIGLLYMPVLLLELGTAFLQAYIFCILSCIYLKDSVECGH